MMRVSLLSVLALAAACCAPTTPAPRSPATTSSSHRVGFGPVPGGGFIPPTLPGGGTGGGGGGTVTSVSGGTGVTVTNPTTTPNVALDNTVWQERVTGMCAAGTADNTINADGTVGCATFVNAAGTGLTLTGSTLGIANTAVTPGAYALPGSLTINAQGQVTAASSYAGTTAPADKALTALSAAGAGTFAYFYDSPGTGLATGATGNVVKLADTAVTPGSYTYSSLTVNQQGQITAASSGATPALASTTITAGTMLSGGGDLSTNRTINLADIATSTVIGRVAAGTGAPSALTTTQLTTLVQPFTNLLSGAVPASGGGTTTYLRADGTFATPPGTGVTSVATGTGLTGGTITTTGTLSLSINGGVTQTCGAGQAVTAVTGVGLTSCTAFGSSSLTNSAGSSVIPKSNGTNLVASSLSDNGTTVSTSEAVSVANTITSTGTGGIVVSESAGSNAEVTWQQTGQSTWIAYEPGSSSDWRLFNGGTDWFAISTTTATLRVPLAMNSQKITSLANGTASSDAAAFGQIGAAVNAAVVGSVTHVPVFTGTNAIGNSAIYDDAVATGNFVFSRAGTPTTCGNTTTGVECYVVNTNTADGNVYLDTKTASGDKTIFRAGAGAELAAQRNWLLVTNATGATEFTQAATLDSTLGVTGAAILSSTLGVSGQLTASGSASGQILFGSATSVDYTGLTNTGFLNYNTSTGLLTISAQDTGATAEIDLATSESANATTALSIAGRTITIGKSGANGSNTLQSGANTIQSNTFGTAIDDTSTGFVVLDQNIENTGTGGAIALEGETSAATTPKIGGLIKTMKQNSTGGNTGFDLVLAARANGAASTAEGLRVVGGGGAKATGAFEVTGATTLDTTLGVTGIATFTQNIAVNGASASTFASGSLELAASGDDYLWTSLGASSGNQVLHLDSAGTSAIKFNSNDGGITNAGTGGLALYNGGNGTTMEWSVDGSGNQVNAGTLTTKGALQVNSASTAKWSVDTNGHMHATASAPTLSSCGTSPTVTGSDVAMRVHTGSSGTTCTITFGTAYTTNAPSCSVWTEGSTTLPTCTISTSAITCTVTVASTNYDWQCVAPN